MERRSKLPFSWSLAQIQITNFRGSYEIISWKFTKFSGRPHSRYSFHAFSSLGLRSLITLFSQPSTTTIIVGYILMVSLFSIFISQKRLSRRMNPNPALKTKKDRNSFTVPVVNLSFVLHESARTFYRGCHLHTGIRQRSKFFANGFEPICFSDTESG